MELDQSSVSWCGFFPTNACRRQQRRNLGRRLAGSTLCREQRTYRGSERPAPQTFSCSNSRLKRLLLFFRAAVLRGVLAACFKISSAAKLDTAGANAAADADYAHCQPLRSVVLCVIDLHI